MAQRYTVLTATILTDESLSSAVTPPEGLALAAIIMPSAWTAASLTFQVVGPGETDYQNLYRNNDGAATELTLTSPTAATTISIGAWLPAFYPMWKAMKVRSGTASSPVTQLGDRTIKLVFTTIY
jgi:hypothetical protein